MFQKTYHQLHSFKVFGNDSRACDRTEILTCIYKCAVCAIQTLLIWLCLRLFSYLLDSNPTSIIHPPYKWKRPNWLVTHQVAYICTSMCVQWIRVTVCEQKQEHFKISYISDPKNVLPVRTAKQIALNMSLCWCSKGSKIRCSITPANTWYL